MTESDEDKIFKCPKCDQIGIITLLKAIGDKILIKQKCPAHGEKTSKIPLIQMDSFYPQFRRGIFRCHQCGQEATVKSTKASGPWILLKCTCPTHGSKLPVQKIWSTIYIDITNKEDQVIEPVEEPPTQTDEKKFCPDCGTPLKGVGDFCDTCGLKIE
jgi:hypothetical protein